MPNIKIVRTLTQTGIGAAFKVLSGHVAPGLQTEDVDVTDLSNDARMEKVPRPQLEETDMTLQCEFAGVYPDVGGSATLVITVTKPDDTTQVSTTVGYIKSAIPGSVDIAGERKLTQDVVFTPDGSNTALTTTT